MKKIIGVNFVKVLAACFVVSSFLALLFGRVVAGIVDASIGRRIEQASHGKVTNAEAFVGQLILDYGSMSLALVVLLGLMALLVRRFLSQEGSKDSPKAGTCRAYGRLVIILLVGVLGLNVLVSYWSGHLLFWVSLYSGNPSDHVTNYMLKKHLAQSDDEAKEIILMGSSQMNAAVEEGLLRESLGNQYGVTELHYPGSLPSDLVFQLPSVIRARNPQMVIVYLSVRDFLLSTSDSGMSLSTLGDVRQICEFELDTEAVSAKKRIGISKVSSCFPLYHYRKSMQYRFLGSKMASLGQKKSDSKLIVSLDDRIKAIKIPQNPSRVKNVGLRYIEKLTEKCQETDITLVVCFGWVHPDLEKRIPAPEREKLVAELRDIVEGYSGGIFLEGNDLEGPTENDYSDPTHQNTEYQKRFTFGLAQKIKPYLKSQKGSKE